MDRVVHPPAAVVEPHQRDDVADKHALGVDRELAMNGAVVDRMAAQLGDERDELVTELPEQPRQLGGGHIRLIVVEQRVIRVREVVEALRILGRKLKVASEVRLERSEVAVGTRLHPRVLPDRLRLCEPRGEVGGHATCLLPLAPDEPDEPGVVGVRVASRSRELCRCSVDQRPDLGTHEALMRDPLERRHRLRTLRTAARRHLRLLIPAKQLSRLPDVLDLGKLRLQVINARHGASPSIRCATIAAC